MGIKSFLSKPLANIVVGRQNQWSKDPINTQNKIFKKLLATASGTRFGKDHGFSAIRNHKDFVKQVPVKDYEGYKNYIESIKSGDENVLWPGKPAYLAKTSGTTSGVKYIPISKESIKFQIAAARDALLNYVNYTGKSTFLDGSLIFLSGSPVLEKKNGIHVGRLSGIVNHHVPGYLKKSQLPTYATNCIEDWENKLDQIVKETVEKPMSLISGIPPWVQMYFDKLVTLKEKPIKDIFPQFSLFVYGGVNFEPYRKKLFETIGKEIDSIETFPASEGFFAFQDQLNEPGLLLLLNSGIFYEFIPVEQFFNDNPLRLTIGEVELDKNYAMVISTNAGLWAYSLGDTVKFSSLNPYRVLVTGRIKHFISAFGEHVIGEEVENAMKEALSKHPEVQVTEFTVAPKVVNDHGMPHHEWFIEFVNEPLNMGTFTFDLDNALIKRNIYYSDLIKGNVLSPLKIKSLKKDAFIDYMRSVGKLGGQNKVPRLSNDRSLADELQKYIKIKKD